MTTTRRSPSFHLLAASALVVLPVLAGCGPRVYEDPVGVMMNREEDPGRRLDAARQAQTRAASDPNRIRALNDLLWERGHPTELRTHAIDQLIALDQAQFKRDLSRRIVLIRDWDTMLYLLNLIEERQWTDMTPTVVRQYARKVSGMSEADRPEPKVLEKLNAGKTARQVVFEVFVNEGDQATAQQQDAAWELLNRIVERETLIGMLAQAPARTPLVVDLKAAAAELHTLPINQEGTLRLRYLRDASRAALWQRAKAAVAKLKPEQRVGLDLRHVPVLLCLDDALIAKDRMTLLAEVGAAVESGEHHLRSPTYDAQDPDYPQQWRNWAGKLCWADLVTLKVLLAALRDVEVVNQLFAQADKDVQDTNTEYGGVIDAVGGWAAPAAALAEQHFIAKGYPPTMRRHDLKFVPPPNMIEHLYTALAHYHFHAQEHRNGQYAGAGRGDLELVERMSFNGLVFTFISRDKLNVDYYQPGGVVIDVGTIRR